MAFEVELPDAQFYEDEVECRAGCPVRTDARGYLLAAADGDFQEAYRISRETNPFASICGKVCGAPCEYACRRADVDEPLAIRNIKGFLTQRHGPETGDLETPLTYSLAPGSSSPSPNGKTVGIVGAGCAGLTCAHDLARLGYRVKVYERHSRSGGMLVQGVPVNRLDRKVVQAEIDSICALGLIEIECGVDVGRDIAFSDVRAKHDAVFIGAGLLAARMASDIPPFAKLAVHDDASYVGSAIRFLLEFNLYEAWDLSGKQVLVYGGGDVAMDASRSALRCGASQVTVACIETLFNSELRANRGNNMACSEGELRGALHEGVVFYGGASLADLEVADGRLKAVKLTRFNNGDFLKVTRERGRSKPEVLTIDEVTVEADLVLFAVGQKADLDFLIDSGVKISDRGLIEADESTGQTSAPGVFAGGDVVLGPKLFIDAVNAGSVAAQGIHAYLQGSRPLVFRRELSYAETPDYARDPAYLTIDFVERQEETFDFLAEPARIATVEYCEECARQQGQRCLACHIIPTFKGDSCLLCNGCVDVCPSYCLRMVGIDRVQGGADVLKVIEMEFGRHTDLSSVDGAAMLFNPLACIRCGLCAEKCPTDACMMTTTSFVDQYTEACT